MDLGGRYCVNLAKFGCCPGAGTDLHTMYLQCPARDGRLLKDIIAYTLQ